MPKVKESLVSRANKLIDKNFEVETKGGEVSIFCKLCPSSFKVDSVHLNTQFSSHIKSTKHLNVVKKNLKNSGTGEKASEKESYSFKLARAFVEAGIPMWKLRHPSIKKLFLDQHKEVLPSVNTFYNKVGALYECTLQQIKDHVGDCPIYLITDETTDALGRFALNILVGKLDGEPSIPMLLSTIFLEKTNNTTVQQSIMKSLTTLYGADIPFERVWLLLTDQAPYMLKAGRGLKQMFPNMKHVTCIVHSLNRVCEFIKEQHRLANKMISKVKAVLSKSHIRRQLYKEICELPYPPMSLKSDGIHG